MYDFIYLTEVVVLGLYQCDETNIAQNILDSWEYDY